MVLKEQKKIGRPRKYKKAITPDEIINEKKRKVEYVLTKRKENKTTYNAYMKNWHMKKREVKNKIKKDIYRELRGHENFEKHKTALNRMATLIKIGCIEKKSKGTNHHMMTDKKNFRHIMETIGYTENCDVWISRDWINIPMRILKWKDIRRKYIDFDRMISIGVLHLKLNMPHPLCQIIYDYVSTLKFFTIMNPAY